MSDKGSAPLLAVFLIGLVSIIFSASVLFRGMIETAEEEIILKQASLAVRSTMLSLQEEVNLLLRSAIFSSSYEVGSVGGDETQVLEKVLEKVKKLENGWRRPNISISISFDNLREMLYWTPDGSLAATGYLPVKIKHVLGPEAHGIKIDVKGPRFLRMKKLAEIGENLDYSLEGFDFRIIEGTIIVRDLLSEKGIVRE